MFTILGADGKEYGPVKPRLIHEWLAEGRANLATKARRAGETTWRTLGDFPEFGAPAGAAPVVDEPPPLAPPIAIPRTDPFTHATAPVAPEARLAPLELRFAGAVVDGVLKVLCLLPATLPVYRFASERANSGDPLSFQETVQATTQLFSDNFHKAAPLIIALIAVQMVLITMRGQSVGKLLFRTRIVRADNGAPAGFLRGFALRSVLPYLVQQVPILGGLFWLVDSCFVFRTDRRCIHDLAAGTKVIAAPKPQD